MPATSAKTVRIACGAWVVIQTVSLPCDLVELGDAAAGLDRGDVDARDVDVLLDRDLGLGEGAVGRGPVARLPVPDVVVLLVLLVGAEHRGARLERLLRIDDHGQRLVLDLDRGRSPSAAM